MLCELWVQYVINHRVETGVEGGGRACPGSPKQGQGQNWDQIQVPASHTRARSKQEEEKEKPR